MIVGSIASSAWKTPTAGMKILRALKWRDQGLPVRVVHEDTWAAAVLAEDERL